MNSKGILCIRKIGSYLSYYQKIYKSNLKVLKFTKLVRLIDIIIIHKHSVDANIIVAPRMQINS